MKNNTKIFRYHKTEFLRIGIFITFVAFLLGGCDTIKNLFGAGQSSVDDIITAAQTSLDKITQQSDNWRDELSKLTTKLEAMEGTISTDSKTILTDTLTQVKDLTNQTIQMTDAKAQDIIGQTGVELRCNLSFVKQGAMDQLQAIIRDLQFWKAHGQHKDYRGNHWVCWINPTTISLYPNGQINPVNMGEPYVVHIFGYNFWADRMPTFELQDGNGQKIRNIQASAGYVTHYQFNLSLSGESFQEQNPNIRIVFIWPDTPDPNTISLVRIQPSLLTFDSVQYNNKSPQATIDPIYPQVVIKNIGGSASDPFQVIWKPSPDAPPQSITVTDQIGPGNTKTIQLPSYTYDICGTYSSSISLSTGSVNRIDPITVKPYCPSVNAPQADPQKTFKSEYSDWLNAIGLFGTSKNPTYGETCDANYHRGDALPLVNVTSKFGNAGCSFGGWVDKNDDHSCIAILHLWVDGGAHVECKMQIFEIGDPKPNPTPAPACSCQH
jgi:hypothetical protein